MKMATIFWSVVMCAQLCVHVCAREVILDIQSPKNGGPSLSPEFMRMLVTLFKPTIFIETGTFYGGTARAAASFFDEVHTIELHYGLYEEARNNLADLKNIHVYFGDSMHVLPAILRTISGTPLFWLDGHWNGDWATGCGQKPSPILEELAAIEMSGIRHGIVLIDDLRDFEPCHDGDRARFLAEYPTVHQLRDALLKINPDYTICVLADTLVAYPRSCGVTPSPFVTACTKSRFFDVSKDDAREIVKIEQEVIACANDGQMKVIKDTAEDCCPHYLGKDYALWYGLMLMKRGCTQAACNWFGVAIDLSSRHKLDHWRLHSYLSEAIFEANRSV